VSGNESIWQSHSIGCYIHKVSTKV
jgi:hypothetical protein